MDLGLLGHQSRQHAGQPQRVLAQRRAQPVVAGRGGVTLVENQVDDVQDRAEACRAVGAVRHLEGDVPGRQGALGADDPLGDRGLRHQERPGDLRRRQAAEQPQGEGDAGLRRQHRMARGEDQPQQVVVDVLGVMEGGRLLRRRRRLQVAADLCELAGVVLAAADQVHGAVPGGGHEPGAGVVGDAVAGPLLQRGDQRVLREFLGDPDVADQPGDGGDHARRLDAEDGLDGAVRVCGGLRGHSPPCNTRTAGYPRRPDQPSAISRTSQVTCQPSPWTFTNREAHSSASALSLHCVIA